LNWLDRSDDLIVPVIGACLALIVIATILVSVLR
jgi:hypothetical protein